MRRALLWRWRWWWWLAVACGLAARPAGAPWCIARSGAPEKTLQAALDYACGPAGAADCAPIQASGLCYLPNTLAAHASYAFNSVFQRARAAPGACDFAGTATITLTDPSYGSCTYPASPSSAGQSGSPGSTSGIPSPPGSDNGGLSPPDLGSGDDSGAPARLAAAFLPLALSCLLHLLLLHTQAQRR
ncbi:PLASMODESMATA CALLOSE-BINDING PROTEIN 2-like [Oryza brachyantha]|uniref:PLASMODESMATA CALLOSE-BINDING PROTEIN 2-like n=1 Tax=Oryza brachyantha TaxID=4533 RepID=UPI001ADC0593|nr:PLASMODESMATA CALLOSE-BINDING PROTEIN 2-like [Oryza brachyantha]